MTLCCLVKTSENTSLEKNPIHKPHYPIQFFLCSETRSFNIRALSLFAGRWSLWVARERPFSRLCGFSLRAWATGQEPPNKHIAAIKGCFGNTSLTFARHPPNSFFSAAKVSQSLNMDVSAGLQEGLANMLKCGLNPLSPVFFLSGPTLMRCLKSITPL